MAKITLFGLAGTGTSSTGKTLAKELKYAFLSAGDFCRQQAKELGISIYERGEIARIDPKFDLEVDERTAKFGKENKDFVVEGWLAWHAVPDSIKIKLSCDLDTRVKRVAHRDGVHFEEAKMLTLSREQTNADRYLKYYSIQDFSADSHFDLVIDTTSNPIPVVIDKIKAYLKEQDLI